MCDVRLFRSAFIDFLTAKQLYEHPYTDDAMYLNNAAYHLQQAVKKTLIGALECVGITVPNTHKITKLIAMISHHGAHLQITEWLDDRSEMLSSWEAETRYNMDFLAKKRNHKIPREKSRRTIPLLFLLYRHPAYSACTSISSTAPGPLSLTSSSPESRCRLFRGVLPPPRR